MPIWACRRAGASLAPSPHMPTICPLFCSALTRRYLSSGSTLAKIANLSAPISSGRGVVAQTDPEIPIARATTSAVVRASPVTMTVRTPKPANSATRAAESSRGGSLSAMSPDICSFSAAPEATTRTLNPLACSSSTMPEAAGEDSARLMTTSNAPLMTRTLSPSARRTVASERFTAGSKGMKVTSSGPSLTGWRAAAARMAASTGSCPHRNSPGRPAPAHALHRTRASRALT